MDNKSLQELILEAQSRGGGLLLNLDGVPSAVVLSVEKYNQLISNFKFQISNSENSMFINSSISLQSQQSSQNIFSSSSSQDYTQTNHQQKKVLVTGGAGYIGAHLVNLLIQDGFEVTIIDNLSAGRKENLHPTAKFIEGDISDTNLLRDIFASNKFYAVFHMAASIEVEESVREPVKYMKNNSINTEKLIRVMLEFNVKNLIFSSTCAVYKENLARELVSEQTPTGPISPYGYSKLLAEQIIEYYCKFAGLKAVVFRYFNACGFDPNSKIVATHSSHLISRVIKAAEGKLPFLTIFGDDYKTSDGTCIRDYVHVLDIAKPHILALEKIQDLENFTIINIGTGKGSTVKEVINTASEVLNKIIPMEIGPRREGDAPVIVADNSKLKKVLNYNLENSSLSNIIKTSWKE